MKLISNLIKNFLLVILLAIVGYLLLVLAFCVTSSGQSGSSRLATNTNASLNWTDASKALSLTNYKNGERDWFTDNLMISLSGHPSTDNGVFKDAASPGFLNPVNRVTFDSEKWEDSSAEYPRYWHGYVIFLRPLLYFFNIWNIYYLIMFIQLGLLVTVSVLSIKKRLGFVIPTCLLTYVFFNPSATLVSLQYNACVSLSLIGCIVVLLFYNKKRSSSFVTLFTILGALTSYFDLLTFPLIVFGLPLMIIVFGDQFKGTKKLKLVISCLIAWGFAYLFMWFLKWVIVWLVCGTSIADTASEAIGFRVSSSNVEEYTGIALSGNRFVATKQVIDRQFEAAKNPIVRIGFYLAIAAFIVMIIYDFIKSKTLKRFINKNFGLELLCCLIVILPVLLWYSVMTNHSMIHYWMTYRNLGVPLFGFILLSFKYICIICTENILKPRYVNPGKGFKLSNEKYA